MTLLFSPGRPSSLVWALLLSAAVALGVAGYLHGHLFWEGYAQVHVIGPLFWLNAIGSGGIIALLLVGRPMLFALGRAGLGLAILVLVRTGLVAAGVGQGAPPPPLPISAAARAR